MANDPHGDDGWKAKWQGALSALGQDFSDGEITWGADRIEPGIIRRYNEVLEFDSALHFDAEFSRAQGYEDIQAPATASFSIPPMWRPGEPPIFDDAARDAQPARSPINSFSSGPIPKTLGFFATDIEMEWLRPVYVGERVGNRGHKLVACDLKETSVGRGAFLTFESEMVSDRGDVVALRRVGVYSYDPHVQKEEAAQ